MIFFAYVRKKQYLCSQMKHVRLNKWFKESLHILGILVLALLMTRFVIYDLGSIGLFAPLEKEMDFQISDIYNAVEENKSVHVSSPDIVVVSVDNHNRDELLGDIRKISSAHPAAIGMDVYFKVSKENIKDTALIETIMHTERLVGATGLKDDPNRIFFMKDPLSFFEEEFKPLVGFINVDADQSRNVIRTFHPYVLTAKGDTLKSFELVLASLIQPEKAAELLARGNEYETIDFISYDIPVIDVELLSDEMLALDSSLLKELEGKMVFIGDIRDYDDMHVTPLHGLMPGVMVHAYALETILHSSYIETTPVWKNWLIAIVISLVFLTVLLIAKRRMSNAGNLLVRVSQFVFMYILVVFGCAIFGQSHVYVDFAPSVLMLGFGALAFDLWFAIYGIITNIYSRIQKHLHA